MMNLTGPAVDGANQEEVKNFLKMNKLILKEDRKLTLVLEC